MMRERRSREGAGNELGQSRLTARHEEFKSSGKARHPRTDESSDLRDSDPSS